MSLANGWSFLSIPGPSMTPERVLRAMHRPSPNIYEGELVRLTEICIKDLKRVAKTEGDVAMYISNGHGAWEAAICNTLSKGDRVLCLGTGRFGPGWGEMARAHGVEIIDLDFGMESAADPEVVSRKMRDEGPFAAVMTVQSDTASSVQNDIKALHEAIHAVDPKTLFMVDCICSFGCEEHRMDDWGVDVMVTACQKGLMTPAGLGFVFFNKRAAARRVRLKSVSAHFDWEPRAKPDLFYQYFNGTAPTHHIFGLTEALKMLVHEEGVEAAWARHKTIAQAVWSAIDAWGRDGAMAHNISEKGHRSWAVSTIRTGPHIAGKIRKWCMDEANVTLGIGLGFVDYQSDTNDNVFRIGHMGHLNLPMIMGTLSTIDTALKALQIPHGEGALEAASHAFSKALRKPG